MSDATLSSIHIHPIKSCHRIDVDEAIVSTTGLRGDRQWQVITDDLAPVTQRQHPVLATVMPEIVDGGLRLSSPGHPTIEVEHPTTANTKSSSMTKTQVDVGDAGDEAGRWFSTIVGQPVRLVALPQGSGLNLAEAVNVTGQPIAFGDLAPVVVSSNASLKWLIDRASEPFGMDRFRSNLVVDTDIAFIEDTWDCLSIGDAVLRQAMPWPRCAVPQVDQDTGQRNQEPAKVLKQHRWSTSPTGISDAIDSLMVNSVLFGIGCSIGEPGTVIAVGDKVTVTSTRDPLIPTPS